jgi:hypothetical protein
MEGAKDREHHHKGAQKVCQFAKTLTEAGKEDGGGVDLAQQALADKAHQAPLGLQHVLRTGNDRAGLGKELQPVG